MSRREARRRPYPAPEGMHWEIGDCYLQQGGVPGFATYYLLREGEHVDRRGTYVDYQRGTGEVPKAPGPGPDRWASVMRESDTLTETRHTVKRFLAQQARRERVSQLRGERSA